jgi:predicted  nucleic acid-binding Zn-ribbon protein
MDLSKVLVQLRQELENLDAAILSLERLQQEGRRRGRPPKALAEVTKASRARKMTAEEEGVNAEEG